MSVYFVLYFVIFITIKLIKKKKIENNNKSVIISVPFSIIELFFNETCFKNLFGLLFNI